MKTIINIDVPDIAKAIEFYQNALGLKYSRIIDNDVAEMLGGSSIIYLLQKGDGTSFSKASADKRSYHRHWTPVHIDFVVENLEQAKEMAIKAGAVCESECIEWMGSRCVTFSDPFGHGFCLIEFSGETYTATGTNQC